MRRVINFTYIFFLFKLYKLHHNKREHIEEKPSQFTVQGVDNKIHHGRNMFKVQ